MLLYLGLIHMSIYWSYLVQNSDFPLFSPFFILIFFISVFDPPLKKVEELWKLSKKCATAVKFLEQFLNIWGLANIWTYSLKRYQNRNLIYPDKRAGSKREGSCFSAAAVWDNTRKKLNLTTKSRPVRDTFTHFFFLWMVVYLCS